MDELQRFLAGLSDEDRRYIFNYLRGETLARSNPEDILRLAREIQGTRIASNREQMVRNIIRRGRGEPPIEEPPGRPPGKASPPRGIPPPQYRRKQREAGMSPIERTRYAPPPWTAEQWRQQVEVGTAGMLPAPIKALGYTGSMVELPIVEAIQKRLDPLALEPNMTWAQWAEWRKMLEAGTHLPGGRRRPPVDLLKEVAKVAAVREPWQRAVTLGKERVSTLVERLAGRGKGGGGAGGGRTEAEEERARQRQGRSPKKRPRRR